MHLNAGRRKILRRFFQLPITTSGFRYRKSVNRVVEWMIIVWLTMRNRISWLIRKNRYLIIRWPRIGNRSKPWFCKQLKTHSKSRSVEIEEMLYYRELLHSFMGLPFLDSNFLICIRVCSLNFDSVYSELTLIYSSYRWSLREISQLRKFDLYNLLMWVFCDRVLNFIDNTGEPTIFRDNLSKIPVNVGLTPIKFGCLRGFNRFDGHGHGWCSL